MTNDAGIVVSTVGATGATLSPDYKESIQEVVAVPVVEIEDASSSAFEEVAQFSIGSFFVSGGFWLGIERVFTEGFKDTLF